VSVELVGLALLLAVVTYPARAVPLLAPGLERLPPIAFTYLRLVGPAVLASLAVLATVIRTDPLGRPQFHFGVEWLAVGLCIAIVAWRRNLLLGLVVALGLTAASRALGVG
jgi:branched-subunit amino acid transport protein